MNNYIFSPKYTFLHRLIFWLAAVLMVLQITSCEKKSISPNPATRTMKVWLHRVNWINKAKQFQYSYSGFELDVYYDDLYKTFLVKHDVTDTTTLTLSTWMMAITDPSRLGYWLDFKNLDSLNKDMALSELLRIRQNFGLIKETIVVESSSPGCLVNYKRLNFRPSFYIPTFDPDNITQEQEIYFRDFTQKYIDQSGIETISAYSWQHDFMQKWFPTMNKLLWFLDSYDAAVKDSVIEAIGKDPTVEILLVPENY
jgi:hypothetical protein